MKRSRDPKNLMHPNPRRYLSVIPSGVNSVFVDNGTGINLDDFIILGVNENDQFVVAIRDGASVPFNIKITHRAEFVGDLSGATGRAVLRFHPISQRQHPWLIGIAV